ncbi:MAG: hypothetical protein LBE36_03780 [Flavobacteriaceae bacterium]|jgi:hypothetical protein|nr:hypothetical protein [Flavobacteriaceae bacterium]
MKTLVLLLFLMIPVNIFSQGIALSIGYQHLGRSAGFSGVDFRISDSEKGEYAFNIGAGTYWVSIHKKFTAIPEFHVNYAVGHILLTELSVSTKNFKPSVGINFLNASHVNFGYSFGFKNDKHLQGIFLGLNFYLGTKSFYDNLARMK